MSIIPLYDHPLPAYELKRVGETGFRWVAIPHTLTDQQLRDELDRHPFDSSEYERLIEEAARRELEI